MEKPVANRIRILHVMSSACLAGTERALLMLMRHADHAAFEHVAALPENGPLASELDALGVHSEIITAPRGGAAYYLAFARLLRGVRPRLLHLHAERLHALPARLLGIPVVERKNLTRDPEHQTLSRNPAMDRLGNRLVDVTITPSEFLRDYYIARGLTAPDRIVAIHNGLDTAPFDAPADEAALRADLGLAEQDIPIFAVGRLVPLKGLEDVIHAMPAILEAQPAARLALIGDGPERGALTRLAHGCGVAHRVIFTGSRNDVPRLLRACRVFVHASRTEALSNAILEAMAARCAVAASDIPGNAEVVRHKRTGLLFPPRTPQALAEAVLRLIGDPQLAESCARHARALIEDQFAPEAMARKTQAVYLKLLGKI